MTIGALAAAAPGQGVIRQARTLWRRTAPALLLAAVFLVSLVGLYALGRSVPIGPGRPSAAGAPADVAALSRSLTRVGWSQPGVPADVILMAPQYFQAVGWQPRPDMNTRDHVIFMVAENIHDGDLPAFSMPLLRVDGVAATREGRARTLADSPHHRTTAVVFDRPAAWSSSQPAQLELVFPLANSALNWSAVSLEAGAASVPAFRLTAAGFVALLGGMVASMWPCLFQLTAYFIPSLAGISASQARGAVSAAVRWRVVKMAIFFVLGFVVVYTLAGAAAGLAAQSFDTRSVLETWQRPLSIVSGLVMVVLALRLAATSRLPVVCKMPLMRRVGHGSQPGYGSAMVMGLAYATGCATCFGAAVLVGMLVYVGVAGAPLTGAAVMFLFSLGMGIPLVLGAALMARVLPILERFTNGARYLALVSSATMLAMAVLLLSGRFMGFSNELARAFG